MYERKIEIIIHATDENFLGELLKIFQDKKIGAVGTSGAIELSTHGVSLTSAKRAPKNFYGEAEIVDGFFSRRNMICPGVIICSKIIFSAGKLNASNSSARATKFLSAAIRFITAVKILKSTKPPEIF